MKKRKKIMHVLYLLLALVMLLYALPMISLDSGNTWITIFGVCWVLFALLVIAAHLHVILGVDEEKKKALERIRQAKYQQWQSKWSEEMERGKNV
ncbi:hypothetical protein [Paenibacillus crassostreae]|uniref:Uncharacterized protein n=1 Tax=Paenibacillus crassostreae TaxID=1763538 RepID=A0A167G1C3_9BACL|nr:hypothetical protein [Paenibacillus crassostreae]AOZ93857.1 hypothetical protein LPB68_17825 [Paenibacillus crassostreae]OAB77110.1 hypothetical protein PNBC_06910 [Paenibacillus crassostreae]